VGANLALALAALPHGTEFRFVDRLLALDAGRSATGEYRVRGDEAFLRGHFPGQPLFPGVLLVEAVAQLAGIVAQTDPVFGPMAELRLTALKGMKIEGSARPGEVIQLEARLTGRLGNLVQSDVVARVAGKVVLRGALTLSGQSQS